MVSLLDNEFWHENRELTWKITLKALHSVQSPVRMLAQHPVRKLAQHPVRMLAQHWSRHTNLPPPTHIPFRYVAFLLFSKLGVMKGTPRQNLTALTAINVQKWGLNMPFYNESILITSSTVHYKGGNCYLKHNYLFIFWNAVLKNDLCKYFKGYVKQIS